MTSARSLNPNAVQAGYWAGDRGAAWVRRADQFDAQLSTYSDRLIESAAPRPGEIVLDVGCGAGVTSITAASAVGPTGSVVGLDISPTMLEVADRRARAAGVDNLRFLCGDAQVASVDVGRPGLIISRFGVMFFDDPTAAFVNIAGLGGPRARLTFVCWAAPDLNEWMWGPGLAVASIIEPPPVAGPHDPGPFAFADTSRVAAILLDGGWADPEFVEIGDDIYLGGPGGVEQAIDFVTDSSALAVPFAALGSAAAGEVRRRLESELAPRFDGTGVRYPARALLVTARRA